MAEITASIIKQLRETTGAGMMDCKKALQESNGDFDGATDWLRTKGLAAAAKKSSRQASEGVVARAQTEDRKKAALVELNSETDFVAKNEQFQQLANGVVQRALDVNGDLDQLNDATCQKHNKKISEVITDAVATIGENINLRRSISLSVSEGIVASYIHNTYTPDLGKIGVLVALESTGDQDKLEEIGKQVAMHVAAAKPEALTRDEVPEENIQRERDIFVEQAKASGKPDDIIEKMIDGRVRKYYEQVVLPEQTFVIDGKSTVAEFIEKSAKDIGAPITLKAFAQFTLGEGIEKEQKDFAEEVAAAVGAA